ncbi:Glycosyltransferase 25 family member [Frankliniella fusca]|uniref:Glycosyltransferase 25 family member n=1 Tax=Frankliniella fusca TaxID=407009 RepID=A0AAE1H110_9NEOP|nr:Glycosyltransferase 25 family member [Frankliniella fusca]
MYLLESLLCLSAITLSCCHEVCGQNSDGDHTGVRNPPTVMIAILARNKAHTLPYFLTLVERLDYPKSRISLWIRSDHNEDNTADILRDWISSVQKNHDYHSISSEILSSPPFRLGEEMGPAHWTPLRFTHVIQLREEALETARQLWADFVWFLDSDVFITEPNALKQLIANDKVVAAPMLASDGMYSNFWCGMTDEYYYKRTDEYQPIYYREQTGCFHVPMVHSSVIIDLRKTISNKLTFVPQKIENYTGPHDDIITFAVGANKSDIPLFVCNDLMYGFVMIPMEQSDPLETDYDQLVNLKLEVLAEFDPLPLSDVMGKYIQYPEPDTLGLDEIYVINLERRPERRLRMERSLKELGIAAKFTPAVDGR